LAHCSFALSAASVGAAAGASVATGAAVGAAQAAKKLITITKVTILNIAFIYLPPRSNRKRTQLVFDKSFFYRYPPPPRIPPSNSLFPAMKNLIDQIPGFFIVNIDRALIKG
jgi:hypothetical protein